MSLNPNADRKFGVRFSLYFLHAFDSVAGHADLRTAEEGADPITH